MIFYLTSHIRNHELNKAWQRKCVVPFLFVQTIGLYVTKHSFRQYKSLLCMLQTIAL